MKKLLPLLLVFLVCACTGKPSISEIEEQVVGKLLSDGADEVYAVENFEKTNGFEKSANTYIADVKYDLVFKKGIKDFALELKSDSHGSLFQQLGAGLNVMALKMQFGNFEPGQRVSRAEKVVFIKTEKGWRIDDDR